MAGIQEYLDLIKNAVYGKDVRQAIHDGIHQCYEDGKAGAVDLEARARIDQIVAPSGEAPSAAEVADARVVGSVTYPSLHDGINSINDALSGILGANKNLIQLSDISYTSGSIPIVQNANDGSITLAGNVSENTSPRVYGVGNTQSTVRVIQGRTYTLSGCPADGGSSKYDLDLRRTSGGTILYADYGEGITFTATATETLYVHLRIVKNYGDGLVFYPQLEEGAQRTSFIPFAKKSANDDIVRRFIETFEYQLWGNSVFRNQYYLDDNTDADTITKQSIYTCPDSRTYTNLPVQTSGTLITWNWVNKDNTNILQQIFIEFGTGTFYYRRKISTWTAWRSGLHDASAGYYAFGDSTTFGRRGDGGAQSPYAYPFSLGKYLNMVTYNKAVSGQGLLKDWDTIQSDYVTNLDMSDAKLITVAWAYNDDATYANYNMGAYTDTSLDTVIGRYYNIMKAFQEKCPTAQVVLITGFGSTNANAQFTASYTFADGTHTFKELYDELEKMANLHGWNCINQSKGCWLTDLNRSSLIGDNIHPTNLGYLRYSNFMVAKIASCYANIASW